MTRYEANQAKNHPNAAEFSKILITLKVIAKQTFPDKTIEFVQKIFSANYK